MPNDLYIFERKQLDQRNDTCRSSLCQQPSSSRRVARTKPVESKMSGNQERSVDEQVRKRAYELWEQEGKPDGRHDEFWHQAQAEISSSGKDNPVETFREVGSNEPVAGPKTITGKAHS